MQEIINNEAAGRFETQVDGHNAFLSYRRAGAVIVFLHTEVPESAQGQGIGGELARAALDYARATHLRVVPRCPFVANYIQRHPEYSDLLHL